MIDSPLTRWAAPGGTNLRTGDAPYFFGIVLKKCQVQFSPKTIGKKVFQIALGLYRQL